jgi:non-ribosomal peptide synthase protein (TIGR01720 family)
MIERRSFANYTQVACAEFGLTRADRVLQFASISFDTAAEEIFPCLASGATLVLRPDSMVDSVQEFIDQTSQQRLSVIDLPTAFWHELTRVMEADGLELPASVRLVIIGGERALPDRVAAWHRISPRVRLLNTYGPTETTIVATMCDLSRDGNPSHTETAPIGRPVSNVETYVLSPSLEPAPIGFPGELYIGGAGLARGYLNQPALTAEKFIPHPFDRDSGKRLYKTGDRVRYLPDGQLQYLGRIDSQVKVRGYRIELQEIETMLCGHSSVGNAVVLADELEPGQKRLVAYVVNGGPEPATITDLRAYLKQSLPDFMVPAVFVFLEKLPVLPNGKVDRRSLPRPEQTAMPAETFVEPRNGTEKTLAEIWAKVLRLDRVGINDNFFELGGDSILSIQIVAKAAQAGLRVTPRDLFQHQSIAELATVAATGRVVRAEQGSVEGEVPLLPSQRGFLGQDWAEPHHFTQAVMLDVQRPLSEELLRKAVSAVVAHHDAFRLRFVRESSGFKQFYDSVEDPLPLTTIDLSGTPAELRRTALEAAATQIQQSLNLELGPLWRVALLDLGDEGLRLLWVIHHLIVDGVSWRILVEDLATAVDQLHAGELVRLPAKTTSLKEWSGRLQSYGRSSLICNDLDYWITAATRWPALVPIDMEGEANTFGSADTVSVELDSQETRVLLQKIPQIHKTQVNEVLLTGLIEAFQKWTGGSLFSVRLEGHGREDLFDGIDLSRTVGWFTTFFPVFFEIPDASNCIETLRCVKEQLRRVPNKGIAFGLAYLTEDTVVLNQLRAIQPPQVLFNYLGQFDQMTSDSSWFAVAKEGAGATRSPHAKRSALLEINGSVVNGKLQVAWTYSRNFHRRETIERVADSFLFALRTLMRNDEQSAPGYTPSDFSEFGWSQDDLNEIVADIEPSGRASS